MNWPKTLSNKQTRFQRYQWTVLLFIFLILLILPVQSHAFFLLDSQRTAPESSQATPSPGLERITSAIDRVRAIFGGFGIFSREEQVRQEVSARKEALGSIIEFLLFEIDQTVDHVHTLSLNKSELVDLLSSLESNRQWLGGMLESIGGAKSSYYLKIIAQDIQQFRDQRHTILVRLINERRLAQRQRSLLDLAQNRTENVFADLEKLEEDNVDTAHLQSLYLLAQAHIEEAATNLERAESLLKNITPPYEEERHRKALEIAHEYLIAANAQTHLTYKLFVEMSRTVNNL